jgi:hypothetical protein
MMQNTFVEILRANTVTENLFSMCLIDEKATNTDFAERVCDYCSTLTIVTAKRDKYNSVCEKITENTGLCPVIKSKTEDEKIIIDLDDSNMQIRIDNNMIINGGEEFIVPEIYNYIKPETINKYDFYSALYELCGVFSLADGVFETIRVNNEKKSIADIHFS